LPRLPLFGITGQSKNSSIKETQMLPEEMQATLGMMVFFIAAIIMMFVKTI
jgi:hypothetical protein